MNAPHLARDFPHSLLNPAPTSDAELFTILDLARFARRSAGFVLIWTVLIVAAASAYVFMTPPSFTARSSLIIDPNKARALFQDVGRTEFVVDPAQIDSQVEVLRSDRIAGAVVRSLDLSNDPEFAPEGAFSVVAFVKDALGLTKPEPNVSEISPKFRQAIIAFDNRLGVARVGQSYVLDVSFRSVDPTKAAKIANAIVAAYIDEELLATTDAARRGAEWLQLRLAELREQTNVASREVLRFKSIGGGGGSSSDAQVTLAELESVSLTYRRLYEALLQKFTETLQKQSYPVADARVIAAASTPIDPSHPKSKLIICFAAVFGLLSGTGVMALRQSFDRRVRSPANIRALGVNCLGAIQRQKRSNPPGFDFSPARLGDMRSIRASVASALANGNARAFGVVGIRPGDGATSVALGLGALFALTGDRTLLVDADHVSEGLSESYSLETHDTPMAPNEGAIEQRAMSLGPKLFALSTSVRGSAATPGDLFSGTRGRKLIEEMRQHFETTIFDLPTLSASCDVRSFGANLDGVVVVADAKDITLDQIEASVAALRSSGANVMGVVINKVDRKARPAWT